MIVLHNCIDSSVDVEVVKDSSYQESDYNMVDCQWFRCLEQYD